jgi:hypothetical protein
MKILLWAGSIPLEVTNMWGEVSMCEFIPHINSCLWIYALNTMKISRTGLSYWLDTKSPTARGVASFRCAWCNVCFVTSVASAGFPSRWESRKSAGAIHVALVMMTGPVAPQTTASHVLPERGAWALPSPELVRTKGARSPEAKPPCGSFPHYSLTITNLQCL